MGIQAVSTSVPLQGVVELLDVMKTFVPEINARYADNPNRH